jgi:hypothetical protein
MTSRPHDAMFKSAFELPADAAVLLRSLLPAAITDAVSWDTLRCDHGSFIDSKGADHHGDLLFRAHLRAGWPECIFFLLEHQSTVDPSMPLRMATYQLQMTLPGLAPLVPRFSMVVLDLVHATNADLQALSLPAFQKLVLWLLRDARAPARLLSNFDAWIPLMLETGQERTGLDPLRVLSHYMYDVVDPKIRAQLEARLHSSSVLTREVAMTIADMIREEGRAQGCVETLRRQLIIKFGILDANAEAVLQTATPKAIDRYLGRVLTAGSLAEVFEGRSRYRAPRTSSHGSLPVRHRRARPPRRR